MGYLPFVNYRIVLYETKNKLDGLFAGFKGQRTKDEIDYGLNI